MTRSYAGEMTKLAETFEWAATADLDPLRRAVRTAGLSPLRAVGSGGSLTGAHALAGLHQRYTGHLAAVATPLEAVGESLDATVAVRPPLAWALVVSRPARRSLRVPARMVAESPTAPLLHRSASADVVASVICSDRYRLERQLPSGIRTR